MAAPRRCTCRILPLALLLFALPAATLRAQAQATISGLVSDSASKRPLVGAEVTVVSNAGTVAGSARAGENGRYTILTTSVGLVTVRVRLVGYAPHWGRFQEGSKTFKLTVDGNLEFNHIAPAVQACADGAGFGQFLSYQVAPLLQSGALETVLDDFADAPRPIHVVYPHARLLPTRTRAFIDFIRQELKGFEPGHPSP